MSGKIIVAFIVLLHLIGCVAPGDKQVRMRVQAHITGSDDSAWARQPLEVRPVTHLGAEGLRSNSSAWKTLQTDEEGRLDYDGLTYVQAFGFWLIPPLGFLPRQPHAPSLALRFPLQKDECWMLSEGASGIRAEVVSMAGNGPTKPLPQSIMQPAEISGTYRREKDGKSDAFVVDLQIRLLVARRNQ